jgi:hypothetical protein
MNNYKPTSVKSPYSVLKEKADIHDKRHPVNKLIIKNTGEINLSLKITEDTQLMNQFKRPGLVSFVATLRRESEIVGLGHGSVLLNQENRWIERGLAFARNTAIINSIMMACKMIDALKIDSPDVVATAGAFPVKDEPDLEGRDRTCSFSDDGTLKIASQKQRTFLQNLIETKCDEESKKEYLCQLNEPYLSSFQASELISSLLPA